jgi:hypothetical protein
MNGFGDMDLVANAKPKPFLGLEHQMAPAIAISDEFRQELIFVTPRGNVLVVTGQKMTIGARC